MRFVFYEICNLLLELVLFYLFAVVLFAEAVGNLFWYFTVDLSVRVKSGRVIDEAQYLHVLAMQNSSKFKASSFFCANDSPLQILGGALNFVQDLFALQLTS